MSFVLLLTAVTVTVLVALTPTDAYSLRRGVAYTWPEEWIPWDNATGRAGLTRPRFGALFYVASRASLALPWAAFWIWRQGLRDRRAPVSLDLFVAGCAWGLVSFSAARQVSVPLFDKSIVYCLAPISIGAAAGLVECGVRRLSGRWWVAALIATGCALAYYALLVTRSRVFTGA